MMYILACIACVLAIIVVLECHENIRSRLDAAEKTFSEQMKILVMVTSNLVARVEKIEEERK